jgi:hypothetical protein
VVLELFVADRHYRKIVSRSCIHSHSALDRRGVNSVLVVLCFSFFLNMALQVDTGSGAKARNSGK